MLTGAPFDDWPAPSAEDYLTDPLYLYEVKFCKILRSDEPGFARKLAKTGLSGWIFVVDNF
jgi:hypothetical protein